MTAAHAQNADDPSVVDCHGVVLTSQVYDWLTVITVTGEIDASNAALLSHHAVRLMPGDGAVIVDMGDVDFIGVDGLRALFAMNIECLRTETTWVLITSRAVSRLLQVGDRDTLLPAVGSATEALQCLRRRQGSGQPLQLVGSGG